MIDKTKEQKTCSSTGAILPGGLMIDDCYNRYYHQFDIYLVCHAIALLAITNKNTNDYILRDIDNDHLESFDMLVKDSETGQRSQHET